MFLFLTPPTPLPSTYPSIRDKPEILVTNYQYPGNPPISQVAVFVACSSINVMSPDDSADVTAHKKLWKAFKDIPQTEAGRLARFEDSTPRPWSYWPSDITWADQNEPGVYPHDDFRNTRSKACPSYFTHVVLTLWEYLMFLLLP
jgi:hypothetical protein